MRRFNRMLAMNSGAWARRESSRTEIGGASSPTTWFATAILLLPLLLSCRTMPSESGFLNRSVIVDGRTYPYVVYVPRDYERGRHLPVLLALHGSGERGEDGLRQLQIGAAAAIRSHPEWVKAIAVFPQAPADSRWLGGPADAAMRALESAIHEYGCDRHRIYLTGLSMGGYGTYHLLMAHPGYFAAAGVVCGGLLTHPTTEAVRPSPWIEGAADPYASAVSQLGSTPVWIVHGDADPVIPVEESRRMFAALKETGAPVHYVEYAGVGHNSWDRAYADNQFWNWLFAQAQNEK